MPNLQDKNHDLHVFDFANQAVIADAVFPQFAESRPLQGLSNAPRIFDDGKSR